LCRFFAVRLSSSGSPVVNADGRNRDAVTAERSVAGNVAVKLELEIELQPSTSPKKKK
jgi:hypothetical protein